MKASARVYGLMAVVLVSGAAARAQSIGSPSAASGMVVLDSGNANGALSMSGNASIQVSVVYVNSSSSQATTGSGNVVIDTPIFRTVGGTRFSGNAACTSTPVHIAVAVVDPCSGMTFPGADTAHDLGAASFSGGDHTISPGYYSRGISLSGQSTLTLNPGVYVLGNGGLSLSGGSSMVGEGVSFMILGSGSVSLSGTGAVTLSPTTSGPLSGVVFCQYPMDTHSFSLSGGSNMNITGTIYIPGATLTISGNGQVAGVGPQVGDLVVAKHVTLSGNGLIKIGREHMQIVMPPNAPLAD